MFSSYHWYDTGLKYRKAAIDMFYSLYNEKTNLRPRVLKNVLFKMKKYYPLYHNYIFNKKHNPFEPDWKVYPHIGNTGI